MTGPKITAHNALDRVRQAHEAISHAHRAHQAKVAGMAEDHYLTFLAERAAQEALPATTPGEPTTEAS